MGEGLGARYGAASLLCVSACVLAVASAAVGADEIGPPGDWSRSLLLVGLAAILWGLRGPDGFPVRRLPKVVLWMAVLFPAYVAFQLAPLPLFLLRILSPERSEVAEALRGVMRAPAFSPLTIAPPATWFHLSRIAAYAVVFLLIRDVAGRSVRSPWWVAFPLIGFAGMEAVWGLAQQITGGDGISGSYGNRDHFVGLLEMVLPFAAAYAIAVFRQSVFKAGVALSIAAGVFLGIVLSLSKMGFLAMLGSLFVMGAVASGARFRGPSRWAALGGLAVVLLALFLFLPSDELVLNFGGAASEAATGRWPIWKDTLHLIAAYPLFGSGLGTYFPALLRYQTAALSVSWPQAHNDYLQLLSELGAIGFLIPAILLALAFGNAVRVASSGDTAQRRLLGLACVGGMAAILIHSLADFNLYIPANAMVFAWISGLSAALTIGAPSSQPEASPLEGISVRGVALGCGCLLALYAGGWIIFLHWFRYDPQAEAAFCRVGICDSGASLATRELLHGGHSPAAVPPDPVMEYLRRDPAGSYNWCDLGDSFENAGRISDARYCFARAVSLAPRIPYMLFRAAGFQFDLGDWQSAIELLARAAEADPSYVEIAFVECDKRGVATDAMLRYGLPPGPAAARSYLAHLMDRGRQADAAATFEWMVSHAYADDAVANQYVEFLIKQKQPEAAARAWALSAGARSPGYPDANRIYNGDFERDPSGSRFDWGIEPPKGAKADFDGDTKYSGARSLRIAFDGAQNLADLGIWQSVFLQPGRYRFRAHLRTQDISTDEGVSFLVAAEDSPNRLSFTTEPMRASHDWTLVEHSFDVPSGTGLVRVGLIRKPSLRFDSLIRGTMWADDVAIVPETGTQRK